MSAIPSQGSTVDDFYESQTIDSATALNVYVPNLNITNNAQVDNLVTCRNLLDQVTPPGYWVALRNQHDARFLDSFNIISAQHVCMVSELPEGCGDLRARLEKSEAEAAEVAELRKHVSNLEAIVAVKVGEVATLNTQNVSLSEKGYAFELVHRELDGKDAAERRFSERGAALDAHISNVRRDMDNDLYLHMLTAIARRRWVVRHGIRLAVYKCARSVECHSALGKVISIAINKGIQQGLEAGVVH
ncbi:hypothetical protein Tco_1544990, partial [Tanacetum coccineum]